MFDQTSFSKYLLVGRDAEAALQWLCTADVGVEVGSSVYTGMLNERGTYESDVTVTRTGPEEFLIISSAATTERDKDHIRKNLPEGTGATLVDVTSAYAVFGVMGPKSRDLLSALTSADLSDEAFAFATSRQISLGYATVRATRITYVGELGWELYVPAEFAVGVYEDLMQAGAKFGVGRGGYYTIESLRLEKGYRAFGRELTPSENPVEAGLLFACKLRTDIAFLGREAVEKAKAEGPRKKLVGFTVDSPDAMLWGGELIMRDGAVAGQVTSAAWGETTGSCVGLGIRACVRQLRHQCRLGQSRKLRGQRRRTTAPGRGVAEAALRPDERANTPVARRPGRRYTGWLRNSGCSATSRLCSMGVASTSGTLASDASSWRCWSTSTDPVPADQLIDRVWADDLPHRARNALAAYMSRLRQVLDGADVRIVRERGSYMLMAESLSVDIHRFRKIASQARATADAAEAAALFDSALGLWRGEPFASLDTPWINDVRNAIEAEKVSVTLDRNDTALQAGRHADLLGELVMAAQAYPLDERLAGQLMLAQYRCGRQAGAFETYRLMRDRLVEELGVDPSPTLREVHQRILDGDKGAPHPKGPEPSPDRSAVIALPRRATSFVGRTQELSRLADALHQGPMLTLIGVGGVGKTRLGLEVAGRERERFPDGVWLCELAPLDDGAAVGHAVAAALRLQQRQGLDIEATVIEYLATRELLLILDNCEHLLDPSARLVDRIVQHCPGVTVLSTSREALGVEGEQIFAVPPLAAEEATELFADRARAGRPDFDLECEPVGAVAEICRQLDGLPLAIELAAARMRVMSSLDVARRLDTLRLLSGGSRGAPPRQQSVTATIDWSYRLLAEPERSLFARLSVFAGGFDLRRGARRVR